MSNSSDIELAIVALQAASTAITGISRSTPQSIVEHVIGNNGVGMANEFYKWLLLKRDGERVFTLDDVKFWPVEDKSEDNPWKITVDDVVIGSMWTIPAGIRVVLVNATIGAIDYKLDNITFQSSGDPRTAHPRVHNEALKDIVNKLNTREK